MIKRKKKSKEQIEEGKAEREQMWNLFREIWNERPHYSELSGKWLGKEPLSTMFDHLLEKGNEKYEHLKYNKKNIILITPDEHYAKSNGFPLPKHRELIEQVKIEFGI